MGISEFTPEQVRQVFYNTYLDEHQNLIGVEGAFLWWYDPELNCAKLLTGRGDIRCSAPCPHCRMIRQRKAA